jgi:hypothetical protein
LANVNVRPVTIVGPSDGATERPAGVVVCPVSALLLAKFRYFVVTSLSMVLTAVRFGGT